MSENNDLVWDLGAFSQRSLAQKFVLSIENSICVFSGSVGQLYTNYDIFFPKEEDRKLVILPDPYAPHDTFNGLPEKAVKPTGLLLVPKNPEIPEDGTSLIVPIKGATKRYRQIAFQTGIDLINRKRAANDLLLPVLVKGDLREISKTTPCLHLHTIVMSRLSQLSSMEVDDISETIQSRMARLSEN